MILYDESACYLLLIELKWVIAPVESAEKWARAEREKEGIEQVQSLLQYVEKDRLELWLKCFPNRQMPDGLRIRGCVVMRGFTGTSLDYDPDVPVI